MIWPEDTVEPGDLDGTEHFGVGSGDANGDARGVSLLVAFEDGVQTCATEMRDAREVDDKQSRWVIESSLPGGIEMEYEGGETLRIDLTDCRHHDSGIANVLIHFQ